jgi:hypothetical protein
MKYLILILITFGIASCTTTKDFSKAYNLNEPLDYSNPLVKRNFEIEAVYLIKLKDNRELSFRVKKTTSTSLFGFITNRKNKVTKSEENFLEIPFERIEDAKKIYFDPVLNYGIFAGIPLLILGIFILPFYLDI